MFSPFSILKNYSLWFLAALASIAFALFKIQKAENHTLKANAERKDLAIKLRQSQIQNNADEAARVAGLKGQEKIDADIKAGERGEFRDFID